MIEVKAMILDITMVALVAWSITLDAASMWISIVAAVVVMVIRVLDYLEIKLFNKNKSKKKKK